LTQRTADHHSSSRTIPSDRRTEGSPFRPRSSLLDRHRDRLPSWDRSSNKIAPNSRGAVYSVLPWKCQTVRQAYGDGLGSVADVSISNESGFGRRREFTYGVRNLFETSYIDSMNMIRPCSRLNRYGAGKCLYRLSNGTEKESLKDRRGGVTTFVACGSPGGEI
jgi:hypothetical protein